MSIYENIAFAVKYWNPTFLKAQIEDRVTQALNDAELWSECKDRLQQDPRTLSAGQLQRLCITRALALEPDLLLLDEPCAYIDPISTTRLEGLFVELKRKYTVLIVTHNMEQAARISDYASFYWLGKLIETSPTEKMFTAPDEKLSEDYITGRFS
jgi:phosphate transport system ATP-binding protein